ncbi:MAG: hypothetical protein AB1758_11370 [Candidatus Eremiobacterota bacterium]
MRPRDWSVASDARLARRTRRWVRLVLLMMLLAAIVTWLAMGTGGPGGLREGPGRVPVMVPRGEPQPRASTRHEGVFPTGVPPIGAGQKGHPLCLPCLGDPTAQPSPGEPPLPDTGPFDI